MDSKKKKIAIMSNGLVYGGTDTFVMNIVKGLASEKYDITVILSVDGKENAIREDEVIAIGARILKTCALKGLKGRIKHLIKLFRIIKENNFDVFQTNIDLFNGPNLFVAWLAGCPIRVCHSHNTQQERAIKKKSVILSIYQSVMKNLCWYFSNRRTGCSSEAMNFLFDDRWKNDPFSMVIFNGIDLLKYSNTCDPSQKKKELNITADYTLLTVGRLVDQKNPLFTEAVINELCKMRDDCEFLFAGNGYLEKEIKTLIQTHRLEKKVHLLGNRTDVNELMQCADLFLLPSKFEGLGIVFIEAQAAGLRCIASTEVPSLADCGGVVYLDLSLGAYKWAQYISDILDNPNEIIIDNNRLNKFTISNMVEQMERMFE